MIYPDLKDKVTIISGAAGNLGQAVARLFLDNHCYVALWDRSADHLQDLFPEINNPAYSSHLLSVHADVMFPESIDLAVEKTIAHFGHVDILVNTVGGYQAGLPVQNTPIETWDFMHQLNTRSVFLACKAVIPYFIKSGSGKIVNVAARSALTGKANSAAYTASKIGVVNLTESMAAELKEHNVQVNCVLPGIIDTLQNRRDMPNADFNRWVKPAEIAEVILFLATPFAHPITGAAVPVSGRS